MAPAESTSTRSLSMRKTGKAAVFIAAAAVIAGVAAPAAAAAAATGREAASPPTSVAFSPGSGASEGDWDHQLLTSLGAPGAHPATVHPTRSFAILQAAEYDAVVSITHAAPPYQFSVTAPHGARPDAAADQAAHDVLAALYPGQKPEIDQMLAPEPAASPGTAGKQQGIQVGASVASLLVDVRSFDGSAVTPPPFVPGT